MNTHNIEVGQVFSTKSKLIRALGSEPANGKKARKLQERELARHLNYEKVDLNRNAIIVTEIYAEPKEKQDGRGRHNNHRVNHKSYKYDSLIEDLVMNKLLELGEFEGSLQELVGSRYLDIVDSAYGECMIMGNYGDVLKQLGGNKIGLVNNYLSKANGVLRDSILRTLRRLSNMQYIFYTKQIKISVANFGQNEVASPNLVKLIEKLEGKVYEKLNMQPKDRMNNKKNRRFKQEVISYLAEYEHNINSYWTEYCIYQSDKFDEYKIVENVELILKELTKRYTNNISISLRKIQLEDYFGNVRAIYDTEKFRLSIVELHKAMFKWFELTIDLQEIDTYILDGIVY